MASRLDLWLTDELRTFIEEHSGEGTPHTTPKDFVYDLIRQRKLQIESAKLCAGILEGFQDAIDGRVHLFEGSLKELLGRPRH